MIYFLGQAVWPVSLCSPSLLSKQSQETAAKLQSVMILQCLQHVSAARIRDATLMLFCLLQAVQWFEMRWRYIESVSVLRRLHFHISCGICLKASHWSVHVLLQCLSWLQRYSQLNEILSVFPQPVKQWAVHPFYLVNDTCLVNVWMSTCSLLSLFSPVTASLDGSMYLYDFIFTDSRAIISIFAPAYRIYFM